ncbi:MAG TPA: hypothetical protein DCG33_04125 [Prevotellaceae bacterium]|nr:hypothetical protein [Prevotellaceae bacterium]
MEWSKGISAEYYACYVDPVSWRDAERFEIKKGSISKVGDGLRETADITCTSYETNVERWIRVYIIAKQGADIEREALFTGMTSCPQIDKDGTYSEYPLECYSVLKPCDDLPLQRGWYAPSGSSGGMIIERLLKPTPAPVIIEGESPLLTQSIVAEDKETHLTMIDKILEIINWRLYIDGNGTIHVTPKSKEIVATFGINYDIMETSINIEYDWYKCPNVVSVTSDGVTAIAKDESPDSPLSTVRRGREVWKIESDSDMNDGEGLVEYTFRKLREEQAYLTKISYDRRFEPNVHVGDVIYLDYPEREGEQWLVGKYVVETQDLELSYGITVSEDVYREN